MGDTQPGLHEYRSSVTSQWGEDGIIQEVFRRIGARNSWCVELGAWDGRHLSNVWSLWHEQGWSAVLIEGDEARCSALAQSVEAFDDVHAVHAFVEPSGELSLDRILGTRSVPTDLDLLSIDVDGDDYHLFAGLSALRPRCVLVEFNPTVPPDMEIVQSAGHGPFGASAAAIVRLGKEKGYRLVTLTDTNVILVAEEDFDALGIEEPEVASVFPRQHLTYLISGYDGAAYLSRRPSYGSGPKRLPVLGRMARGRPRVEFDASAGVTPIVFHRPPGRSQ